MDSSTPVSPEVVRAFLAGRDERCPHCDYNLRDSRETVCPECSAPVRLSLQRPVLPRIAVRLAVVVLVVLGITSSLAALMLIGRTIAMGPGSPQLGIIGVLVMLLIACVAGLSNAARLKYEGPPGRAGIALVVGALWAATFLSGLMGLVLLPILM